MLKKILKTIKYLFFAACGVFLLSLAIVIGVGQWHRPIGQADAIIVLGAAINTPASYNRSLEGLRLYQAGKAPKVVLSGGQDYAGSLTEAQYMKNAILSKVSNSPDFILEPNSESTLENIENSKKLLGNAHSVIIVSDTYHLARGVIVAKTLGFSPVYWSAPNSQTYYSTGELCYHYLREALALIDYLPKLIFAK